MKLRQSILLFAVMLAAGCHTGPVVIPADLGAAESFQRAQDAADNGNYTLAIRYYSTFLQNHPENKDRGAWAQYEIAFNYHKMGRNATALTYLDQLLQQYQPGDDTLPAAPRILAQKLKDRLSVMVTGAK
ncbi:MAG: tetratricopeptide repeat protein [Spirochaetia bacterium]|jgi:outer membrane protein assembly factor BamD (BamD/ComL family)